MVPASHGVTWLVGAAALIRRQTLRLLTAAIIVQLILGLTRFPVLGILVGLAIPILSAGMLQSFHQVRKGLPLSPLALFQPFGDSRLAARLFLFGGMIGAIALIIISWLLSGIDELREPELLERLEQGNVQAVMALDPKVVWRAFLAIAVGIAVSGTLAYFTVPLIWFGKLGIGAALGLGLKALIRNWLPFVMLGVTLTALSIPLFLLLGLVAGIAAVSGSPGVIQYAMFMLVVLAVQLLMFGTQYCAFSEIFELQAGPGPGSPPGDSGPRNQLVA